MATITIDQITESLRGLPVEKLAVVYDFVSYLAERETPVVLDADANPIECMFASESVLRENWDRTEEDEAWKDL